MAEFRSSPETFIVEEIPAYAPSGEGEHTFVWIEKQDLTTDEAVKRMARALDLPARDVGYAGKKDRHATTRQWLSLPRIAPDRVLATPIDGITVKQALLHGNKLRMGHTHGNRFTITVAVSDDADAERARLAFDQVLEEGLINLFGHQRFGTRGDNVEVALAVLRRKRNERDPRRRRFLYSALQSEIFNLVTQRRSAEGTVRRVLEGDILQKTETGGLFATPNPTVDQPRLDAGALVVTGPMPGNRVQAPLPDTAAGILEAEATASVGLEPRDLVRAGRDLPGTRRPLVVPVRDGTWAHGPGDPHARLQFTLPGGSYATVLVAALGIDLI